MQTCHIILCYRSVCYDGSTLLDITLRSYKDEETWREPAIYSQSGTSKWGWTHIKISHTCPDIIQRGTTPAEASEKDNNQPHIVFFSDEDPDTDAMKQFFVCAERNLMLQCSNVVAAIYLLLC